MVHWRRNMVSCFICNMRFLTAGGKKRNSSHSYTEHMNSYTVFACFLQTQRRGRPRGFQPVGSSTLPLFASVKKTRRFTSVPGRFCLLSTSAISAKSRSSEMCESLIIYRNMTGLLIGLQMWNTE